MKAMVFMAAVASCNAAAEQDRTITKVVKLLQNMLKKSVVEGDAERKIFAKFQCYCDQNEAEKKDSIKKLTEQIALLESNIAEIQGDTGGLSSDCADLKTKMAENEEAREEAKTIREKEQKSFEAEEIDLEAAIAQMKDALETLAAVGADQTKSTGADNKQFMAGFKGASFLNVQSQMQTALRAASALMSGPHAATTAAFLQAPFTGTYTSQSAQVMGIIKSMRDTFEQNLADARKTEENAIKSYNSLLKIQEDAHKEMKESYEEKQKELGGNDGNLGEDKKLLASAEKQKGEDEAFLAKLVPMCADKAAGYANRKMLRANEEAAIAESVSILNSDAAFATFGSSSATKTGATAFTQMRSVSRHMAVDARKSVQTVLQKAAADTHSARLSKVMAMLQGANPFDEVLKEISNMLEVIKDEGEADQKKFDWCKDERKTNKEEKASKKKDITSLKKTVNDLIKEIENPKDGLKLMIADTEDSLLQNKASQETETKARGEENSAYQKDVKNLVQAESILKRAISVLSAYYEDLESKLNDGKALLQEDPTPPEAWKGDGAYAGQKKEGNNALDMLEFIRKETVAEEDAAHKDEDDAQTKYDASMDKLKESQGKMETSKTGLEEDLATAEKSLLDNQESLKDTVADKEAIEDYLDKIRPGCDFIKSNFKLRNANRATESKALKKAVGLIEATPAYKSAEASATVDSYGDCKESCVSNFPCNSEAATTSEELCVSDAKTAKCLACKADVTVVAYCTNHKAPGC